MIKLLIILTCLVLLISYNVRAQSVKKAASTIRKADSSQKGNADNADSGPSFSEVKSELLSQYNKVERIDTTITIGKDVFHIHEKYYCLKDRAIVVPKKYLWGGDKTKDFVTHSFVSSIIVIKNRDTIINKIFRKTDFDRVLRPELRKYATVSFPTFEGYKKKYNGVIFCYSIGIPLTDVGIAACIAVDVDGHYQILDEYAKVDEN